MFTPTDYSLIGSNLALVKGSFRWDDYYSLGSKGEEELERHFEDVSFQGLQCFFDTNNGEQIINIYDAEMFVNCLEDSLETHYMVSRLTKEEEIEFELGDNEDMVRLYGSEMVLERDVLNLVKQLVKQFPGRNYMLVDSYTLEWSPRNDDGKPQGAVNQLASHDKMLAAYETAFYE